MYEDDDWIERRVIELKSRIRLLKMKIGYNENPIKIKDDVVEKPKPTAKENSAANDLRAKLRGKAK